MIKNGFYLKELRITGPEKKDANITFNLGLNVISGASDTGKSYIYQCLYFMLGGSSSPKSLDKEDIGYENVFLQIETYQKDIFTLKRRLNENSYFVWNCDIDMSYSSIDYETYSLKHSAEGNNISTFLLSFMNANNFKIKKNQKGKLQNFTINSIKPFIMIDEEKIISEKSIFFVKGYNVTSLEKSEFRTLLTGYDDKECNEVESPDIQKAKIDGKIEFLNELIERSKERIKKKESKINEINIIEIEKRISELTNNLAGDSKLLQNKTIGKKELWENLQQYSSKVVINDELLNRFKLLKSTLLVDIERLSFIQEGNHYISQLVDVNCPTCDSKITINDEKNFDIIIASCAEEHFKIQKKLNDLEKTIEQIIDENSEYEINIERIKKNIDSIDNEIESIIKPTITISKKELNQLQSLLDIKNDIGYNQIELNDYISKKDHYVEIKISGKSTTDYKNDLSENIFTDLNKELYKILESWKYSDLGDVIFDHNQYDYIINKKSRKSHGKGHRALLYSAFIIAVFNYCIKKNSNSIHPGFIILDSPLTSYKEADKETVEDSDIISLDTEQRFFEYLSKYKKNQIIILDNKVPDNNIEKNITHHHFTRNTNEGRYGFFPKN